VIENIISKFVINENNLIRKKILNDLEIIVNTIFTIINKKSILTIVLGGGFGRGEGSAFVENDQVVVVNDYDIDIIFTKITSVKKYYYLKKLEKAAEKIAEQINIKQIDLSILDIDTFLTTKETIAFYELVNNYRILYGKDILRDVKEKINFKIPKWEGLWLFRNRGMELLINELYMKKGFLSEKEKQNFWIEFNKGVQAVGDAYLVRNNNYLPTLYARYQYFVNTRLDIKIKKIYIEEVRQKLFAERKIYDRIAPIIQKYRNFLPLYVECMEKYMRDFSLFEIMNSFIKESKTPLMDNNYYKIFLRSSFLSVKKRILGTELKRNRLLSIYVVFLLLKYRSSDFSDVYSEKELKKVFFVFRNLSGSNFFYQSSKMLLLSIHPTGEAGRIAKL